MVWSLALRSDDAKQDPVVYGTKFSVVFLAEGPRTASIQEGFDTYSQHFQQRMDRPGKVANPARGQQNTENNFFPVPVRA